MFRKTAFAMAMLGAFASADVAALGLGEIELKSALNQPLNAEVEVLSATRPELDELKVAVASTQAFANAGIDRPLFLNKLRFEVTRSADGKPVIRITSRDVVREPFLDFLLEMSWSKGRLVREYTVLVDPPVTMPAPAPLTRAPLHASAAPRRATHTAQMPPVSFRQGEYGPTRRNDTLWSIAESVRPDSGVSVEQTMLGLLRANPEAFTDNNINNLKAGYVLRVPDRQELTSITRGQALRETRQQYSAWRNAPSPVSPVASAPTATASATATDAAASSLQLVAADAPAGVSGAKGLKTVQQELLMANEALEEQRRQSEEVTSRLNLLEEQIANMQRLIQLKDNELARLQAQAATPAASAAGATAEASTATEATEITAPTEATLEAAPSTPLPAAGGDESSQPAGDTPQAQTDSALPPGALASEGLAQHPAETPQSPPMTAPTMPEADPSGSAPAPVTAATSTTPGFIDRLLANPLWLGAGAALLVLLGFIGWRRKRSVETDFQESILQASHATSRVADSEIVASEPLSEDAKPVQSSLLSEFAVSDMGSIRNDGEADPLAEADVYLAYGRYQQAEDLIKDALEKDYENEDLNLKLLEVFLAAHNTAAFDDHAQLMLVRLGGGGHPAWEKVAEMGRELNPDNPIYHEDSQSPALSDESELNTDDLSADSGVEERSAPQEDPGLDFDIDLAYSGEPEEAEQPDRGDNEPQAGTEPEASTPQDAPLEFNLEDFDGQMTDIDEPEQGNGELADLDEVSTKLDLARAYIDMGDPDGAKSILDEVMEEGNEEQQEEARGIMALITS